MTNKKKKFIWDRVEEEHLSANELFGYFYTEEDKEEFELDLNQAREDRVEEILNKSIL